MSKNSTAKLLRRLSSTISRTNAEKADLTKKIGSVPSLETQISILIEEKQQLAEFLEKRDAELLVAWKKAEDFEQQLKEVRVKLGTEIEENERLENKLDSTQHELELTKDVVRKHTMRIQELESSERDLKKLRRRVQESHQDSRILAQKLRERGEGPQAGETNYKRGPEAVGRLTSSEPNIQKEGSAK